MPLLACVKLGLFVIFFAGCETDGGGLAPKETRVAKAKAVGLSIEEWERGEARFSAVAARAEIELEPYRVTTGPVLATVMARGGTKGRRFVIEAQGARMGDEVSETEFAGGVTVASDGVAIAAERLVYDGRRNTVRLEGQARATGPRGRVLADRVRVNLVDDEAVFEGNVRGTMLVE